MKKVQMSDSQRLSRAISTTAYTMLDELGIMNEPERALYLESSLINLLGRVSIHRTLSAVEQGKFKPEKLPSMLVKRIDYIVRKLQQDISRQLEDLDTYGTEVH